MERKKYILDGYQMKNTTIPNTAMEYNEFSFIQNKNELRKKSEVNYFKETE